MIERIETDEEILFTDREKFLKIFDEEINTIKPDEHRVLVFYGLPGIGKSAIRNEFIRRFNRNKYQETCWGLAQFDDKTIIQPEIVLNYIVNDLKGSSKKDEKLNEIKFFLYDYVIKKVWKKLQHYEKKKEEKSEKREVFEQILNILGEVLSYLLIIPAVIKIFSIIRRSIKVKQLVNKYEDKIKITDIENREEDDIRSQLIRVFGVDMKEYIEGGRKAVIFLDGFENIWKSSKEKDFKSDEWVRNLIEECPGVIFVIFSRQILRWEELKTADEGKIWADRIIQYKVSEFEYENSEELLRKAGIDDKQIKDTIIKNSEGVPFYVKLSVDICNKIVNKGGKITSDTFKLEDTKERIVDKFVGICEDDEEETLKALSVTRFFNEEIFDLLVTEMNTGYPATAFYKMKQYSFFLESDFPGTYKMHYLFEKHLEDEMKRKQPYIWNKGNEIMFNYYKKKAEVEKPQDVDSDKLVAFYEAVFHGSEMDDVVEVLEWFNRVFRIYFDWSTRYKKWYGITEHLKKLKERLENLSEERSYLYAGLLNRLSLIYIRQEAYESAENYTNESILICENQSEENHKELGVALHNLGWIQYFNHLIDQSEQTYLKSLEVKKIACGKEHLEVARTLNNLGVNYSKKFEFRKAINAYKRCIEIRKKKMNEDNTLYSGTLSNIGYSYFKLKQYEKAEEIYLNVINIREKYNQNQKLILTLDILSQIYLQNKEYDKAEDVLNSDLEIRKLLYDDNSLPLSHNYVFRGWLYTENDRYEEAEELLEKALEIRKKEYENKNPEHYLIAFAMRNLGRLYLKTNRIVKSMEYLEKSLKMLSDKKYPHNIWVSQNLEWLIESYEDNDQTKKVEKTKKQLSEYDKISSGEDVKEVMYYKCDGCDCFEHKVILESEEVPSRQKECPECDGTMFTQ